MTAFREATLSNGLRVVAEVEPAARSLAVGFWVRTGARDEERSLAGVSHFLEHMCFKGTDRRDALAISRELDEMGARANAFTSWEKTTYFAQVLPEFLPKAVDLLADMMRPALRPDDFDVEKKVILEEIEMYRDRPDYLLFEAAMEHRYRGHPLETRVLGTPETIGPMTVEAMRAYHAARYVPGNIVLAAAGAVAFDRLVALAEAACGAWAPGTAGRRRPPVPPRPAHVDVPRPNDRRVLYIALWDGPSRAQVRARVAAQVAATVLGDEDGSRLHWALVHPGVAESADAGVYPLDGVGVVYAGFSTSPERFDEARSILHREVERFLREGPTAEEVERAATKTASSLVLSGESPMGRFHAIGVEALHGLPYRSIDDEIRDTSAVGPADVAEAARRFEGAPASVAMGPLDGAGRR